MAKAVVRSKAMALLLLVHFLCTPIVFWVFVLVCITLSPFLSCNHLDEEEELVALLLLSFGCLVTINIQGTSSRNRG